MSNKYLDKVEVNNVRHVDDTHTEDAPTPASVERYELLKNIKLNYVFNPEGRYKYLSKLKVNNLALPSSFSLASRYKLKIYSQGQLGSCVPNSFAGVMNSLYNVSTSRLYSYFNARVGEGYCPKVDSGLDIVESLPIFNSFGYVPETTWPYDIEKFSLLPPIETYKISKKFDFTYKAVEQNSEAIRYALYTTGFVIFGIICYTSFTSEQAAKTGFISIPLPNETIDGGHCLNIVGWLTINGKLYYIARNSWGKSWGNDGATTPTENFYNDGNNGGFCYIPEEYILNPNLSSQFVVVQKAKKEIKTVSQVKKEIKTISPVKKNKK
jgi:C1A family cysteine protease